MVKNSQNLSRYEKNIQEFQNYCKNFEILYNLQEKMPELIKNDFSPNLKDFCKKIKSTKKTDNEMELYFSVEEDNTGILRDWYDDIKYKKERFRDCESYIKDLGIENVEDFEKSFDGLSEIEKKYKRLKQIELDVNIEINKFIIKSNHLNYFTSLNLKNFKGFSENNDKDCNTINIKPITLIYGPNSYGKSSLLQSLLMMNQTIGEGEDYKYCSLVTNGNKVNLGEFNDFLNKYALNKTIEIELTLPRIENFRDKSAGEVSFCYCFRQDDADSSKIILSKLSVYLDLLNPQTGEKENKKILISEFTRNENGKYKLSEFNKEKYCWFQLGVDSQYFRDNNNIPKTSFFQIGYNIQSWDESYEEDFDKGDDIDKRPAFDIFENIIKNIVYVSSYRIPPRRVNDPKNNARRYVGKNGEYTAEVLTYDSKNIIKDVNKWLEKIAGYKLSETKKKGYGSSINLDDNSTEIKDINILDLGSGIAQVLPVITQAFKSQNDMILIEEPETHLHPRAQAELGSMFADAFKKKNNTFLIETHSENLLLRLESLVRNGELSKDDVSIIYVDKDKNGSRCIALHLDDEGDIENIDEVPNGFFEESFNELFDVNKE